MSRKLSTVSSEKVSDSIPPCAISPSVRSRDVREPPEAGRVIGKGSSPAPVSRSSTRGTTPVWSKTVSSTDPAQAQVERLADHAAGR